MHVSGRGGAAGEADVVEEGKKNRTLITLSSIINRALLARAVGGSYDGKRDMYEILGYPKDLLFEHFMEKYTRGDIAGKVVDLPAQETWRKPPLIKDGEEDSSMPQVKSAFLQAVKFLIEKRRLWHYLQRVDKLSGIGRYGVLLIGARGGLGMEQELPANSMRGPEDVLYFSVFSEGSAMITDLVRDPTNERFGLVAMYTIKFGEQMPAGSVHWSRTMHVAEDLLEDEIYGMPRLERVFNRLEDLLKLIGGGAEAAWKNMDRGIHADVRDGFDLGATGAEELSDEIDEYIHGLRRFIRTQGVDINALGSEMIDPTGLFTSLVALIAAATDIPQRILLGSERGELASSQDQAQWAGTIAARQSQYAEPAILRPLVDRLITFGALPKPDNGEYQVDWPSLFELNELEQAKVAETYANAIAKVAPGGAVELVVTADEVRERLLKWPAMEIEQRMMAEEEADEDDALDGEEDVDGSDENDANDANL